MVWDFAYPCKQAMRLSAVWEFHIYNLNSRLWRLVSKWASSLGLLVRTGLNSFTDLQVKQDGTYESII